MQIAIEIPDECYANLLNNCHLSSEEIPIINLAIAAGTSLPKGHGRLGDLDELTQRITNYIEHDEHMMDELTLLQEKFILEGIKNTPTIIEADKEQTDGND